MYLKYSRKTLYYFEFLNSLPVFEHFCVIFEFLNSFTYVRTLLCYFEFLNSLPVSEHLFYLCSNPFELPKFLLRLCALPR